MFLHRLLIFISIPLLLVACAIPPPETKTQAAAQEKERQEQLEKWRREYARREELEKRQESARKKAEEKPETDTKKKSLEEVKKTEFVLPDMQPQPTKPTNIASTPSTQSQPVQVPAASNQPIVNTQSRFTMEVSKKKCEELGFKPATEEYGKCVLQLSK